jgi:hypothetical protein
MKYAVGFDINPDTQHPSVPCGTGAYTRLDGRYSVPRLVSDIEDIPKYRKFEGVAVVEARSFASKTVRVLWSTHPNLNPKLAAILTRGAYKP